MRSKSRTRLAWSVAMFLEGTQLVRECLAAERLVVVTAALVGRQIQIQADHRRALWFERRQFLQVVGQWCVERGRTLGHPNTSCKRRSRCGLRIRSRRPIQSWELFRHVRVCGSAVRRRYRPTQQRLDDHDRDGDEAE